MKNKSVCKTCHKNPTPYRRAHSCADCWKGKSASEKAMLEGQRRQSQGSLSLRSTPRSNRNA